MEIVKKYKTISILIGLIIIFGVLSFFVKVFDIGGIKTNPEVQVKITVTPTPTPVTSDPFIHPESINIPTSYMGYSITKVTNGDLSKSALKYGSRSVDLSGTEWVIKKSSVLEIEYTQTKSVIDSTIQGQLVNKGWKKTLTVNGQKLAPNIPSSNNLASGYLQVSGGKLQAVILEGNRDESGNVLFKLFLSNIIDLKAL
jgi:hypothetical protein